MKTLAYLTVQVHLQKVFYMCFFHEKYPRGPLKHTLKIYFECKFKFAENSYPKLFPFIIRTYKNHFLSR
jgi:hypothetical protein